MFSASVVKYKAAAFGILERGGEVRLFAVPNRKKKALQGHISEHVEEGTPVYTDALMTTCAKSQSDNKTQSPRFSFSFVDDHCYSANHPIEIRANRAPFEGADFAESYIKSKL